MSEAPSLLVISNYRNSLSFVRPEGRWFVGLAKDFGYRITLMTERENASYLKELEAAGVRIIDWYPQSKFGTQDRDRIARELQDNHYDLLHLFGTKSIIAGLRAAKNWSGKVLTYQGRSGEISWWAPMAYFTHLHPRVNAITCVSQAVKDGFIGTPFFNKDKCVVVSKGHDPAWYANIEPTDLELEFKIPRERTVLIVVANSGRGRGMDYLGSAIRKLPADLGLHFLFVGRGLRTPEFESLLTDSYYAHQYTFADFREDALNLLAAADISLVPSIKGEGLSKVLLESMSLGLPTIMNDIAGNRRLGVDGETALIIPPKDEEAMQEAMMKLAEYPDLRNRLGVAGRAYVARQYHADKTVVDLDVAYRKLVNR